MNNYRVIGEIFESDLKEIYDVAKECFSESVLRFKNEEEIFIKDNSIDLNIYEYAQKNKYLIGGFIKGSLEEIETILKSFSDSLLKHGIKYVFECCDESTDEKFVLKHPQL